MIRDTGETLHTKIYKAVSAGIKGTGKRVQPPNKPSIFGNTIKLRTKPIEAKRCLSKTACSIVTGSDG